MPFVTRKTLATLAVLGGVGLLAVAGLVWSGAYNIGADDPHWRPTHALLEAVRERSIDMRAGKLQVPADLGDPDRIRQGAGNYAAMCTGCHLAPGMAETELSKGLYPAPPDLTKRTVDAAEAFWVVKHGIKASGMPAWGLSMEDRYIWNMAAFLQELPKLDAAQYQTLVASSEGHSHGGGETRPHEHPGGMAGDHHQDEAPPQEHVPGAPPHDDARAKTTGDAPKPHSHAPGTPPHEDAPAKTPASTTKPDTHAPGTPPHDDGASSKPAAPAHEHRH